MFLRLKDLSRPQKILLFTPLLFAFWPLLNFDWRPISELQVDEDTLIHHLHERSLEQPGSCLVDPTRLCKFTVRNSNSIHYEYLT